MSTNNALLNLVKKQRLILHIGHSTTSKMAMDVATRRFLT